MLELSFLPSIDRDDIVFRPGGADLYPSFERGNLLFVELVVRRHLEVALVTNRMDESTLVRIASNNGRTARASFHDRFA